MSKYVTETEFLDIYDFLLRTSGSTQEILNYMVNVTVISASGQSESLPGTKATSFPTVRFQGVPPTLPPEPEDCMMVEQQAF